MVMTMAMAMAMTDVLKFLWAGHCDTLARQA